MIILIQIKLNINSLDYFWKSFSTLKSFEILRNLIVVGVGVTLKCHILFEWIKMICYLDVMYIIWNKHWRKHQWNDVDDEREIKMMKMI